MTGRTGAPRGFTRGWLVLLPLAALAAGCTSGTSSSSGTSTTSGASTTASTAAPSTTTSTTAAKTTTTAGLAVCPASQLTMAAQTGSGAAGTIEMSVTMVNHGAAPCGLNGYPGMQLLDANGSNLPTNVVRGGGPTFPVPAANQPPAQVVLAPNATAAFSFSYSDVPVGNESSCPTSAKSEVTPPNDVAFAVIALQIAPCGGGTIHVSPVYLAS